MASFPRNEHEYLLLVILLLALAPIAIILVSG